MRQKSAESAVVVAEDRFFRFVVVVGATGVVDGAKGAAAGTGVADAVGRGAVVRFRVVATVVAAGGTVVADGTEETVTEETVTGGGAAVTASVLPGSRSADAHAVVEATTTTATRPNPTQGNTWRIRPGRAT